MIIEDPKIPKLNLDTDESQTSNTPSSMCSRFNELPINEKLKLSLENMNMIEMTPIQSRSIPYLLEGKDLLGAAKTGSGKTLSFLVPLVEKVMNNELKNDKETVAIILSPTRELSIQTYKVLEQLIVGTELRVGVIIGGNNRDEEARYLKQGISILVATPGRLLDHLNNTKGFVYHNLRTLIIDEADRLMNQGFMEDMRAIIKKLPKDRQTVLFSATLNVNSGKLRNKMKKIEHNDKLKKLSTEEKVLTLACISLKESCVCVDMSTADLPGYVLSESETSTVSQLTQNYVVCDPEDRFRLLCTLLKRSKEKKVMIFMSTCLEVKFYHLLLKRMKSVILGDTNLLALQGKQKQTKREENFEKFKTSEKAVLLCTDIAARGLDIPRVDLVVQFDPPEDHKEYIHRVGRTARAGLAGQALIFLRSHEVELIEMLRGERIPVSRVEVPKKSILDIQVTVESIVTTYDVLHRTAREAYKTVVSAYVTNPNRCFDIEQLDLRALGLTFGLRQDLPVTVLKAATSGKKTKIASKKKTKKKREAGMNSDDDNYYIASSAAKVPRIS